METKIQLNRIEIGFKLIYSDVSSSETSTHTFEDALSIGIAEDTVLKEVLSDKTNFKEIAPILIKKLTDLHGLDSKVSKQLLKDAGL